MADGVGIARLLLAAVFAVAALSKLADPVGTRRAATGLGVPEVVAMPIARVVPVAELVVAVALLISGSERFGAAGALVLLAAFTVAISVSLARGRRPDCHCFGQIHSTPVGASTLVRNLALAGLAVFVLLAAPGGS